VPVVSANAVQIANGKRYVFVLAGDKAVRREIETGVDEGSWLEVNGGLKPGDEVVTAGADGLADGSTVRVARDVDPYTGSKVGAPTATPSASEAHRPGTR